MNVEIYGGGFGNKGAELMLSAVSRKLRSMSPSIRPCIDLGNETFEQKSLYQLRTLFPPKRVGRVPLIGSALMSTICRALPKSVADIYGLTPRSDVTAMLDISGYAFGDGWGPGPARAFTCRASEYKRQGAKVVMLPQMFGPFDKAEVRAAFVELLSTVDLMFARDRRSLESVTAIEPTAPIRLAPDITVFEDGELPKDFTTEGDFMCIVPNERMFDQGRSDWAHTYMQLLKTAGMSGKSHGLQTIILIHASKGRDLQLGRQLSRELDDATIVADLGPRKLKGIISKSKLLVGSRFHAIVAALSSGVPALTLGWAHKYPELLSSFDVPDLEIGPHTESGELAQLISSVLCEHPNITKRINTAKEQLRGPYLQMWSDISRHVNGG